MGSTDVRLPYRERLDAEHRAARRFSLHLTVEDRKSDAIVRLSRSSAACHEDGKDFMKSGYKGRQVLNYRVTDAVTGNDVPLADIAAAPEFATEQDRAWWRTGFSLIETSVLEQWVRVDRAGGPGTPYEDARLQVASEVLAVRRDEPAPVKRMPRGAAKLLERVA